MSLVESSKITESLPRRMQELPVDERGYVVPWFVAWENGKPEFRAMDADKFVRALKEKLCWVCGEKLGVNLCFVAGPMCGINRTSSEPPSHVECAEWSARNCPFLSNPHMVRREDEELTRTAHDPAGLFIRRNPGVAMLWITREYEIFPDGKGGHLVQMGEPERVEWWAESRPATRQEVLASIDSGIPNLEAIARLEHGGIEALQAAQKRFEKWLPD
jgi:hypothetical protein